MMTREEFLEWMADFLGEFGADDERLARVVGAWFDTVQEFKLTAEDMQLIRSVIRRKNPGRVWDFRPAFITAASDLIRGRTKTGPSVEQMELWKREAAPPGAFRQLLARQAPHLLTPRMVKELKDDPDR